MSEGPKMSEPQYVEAMREENRRLCAEVERLHYKSILYEGLKHRISQLERERDEALDELSYLDSICYLNGIKVSVSKLVEEAWKTQEALAQVAVLLERLPACQHSGSHKVCDRSLESPIYAQARALLDRLQRAEAGLAGAREALQEIRSYHTRHYGLAFKAGHMAEIASKALAAWEEGKA